MLTVVNPVNDILSLPLKNISPPLAVAVSGGPDSLALLLLAQKWVKERNGHLVALTVDHGLRTTSTQEVHQVHQWATQKGIEHVILSWEGPKPSSRIQEKARHARYELLTAWCNAHHIPTLLLGHHQEDQEETFWMRLAAGSHLEGLTGIKERTVRNGVTLMRPLLGVSKPLLKDILRAENQEWLEDPSNTNTCFLRGKLRQVLRKEGLSSSRLLKTMQKLQEDADFIRLSLHEALKTIVTPHEAGFLSLHKDAFFALHPALSVRLLSLCIQWFSSSPYPPRSQQIEEIRDNLTKGLPFTSGKIYWFVQKDRIYLSRELSQEQTPLWIRDIERMTLWDNRFWIDPAIKAYLPAHTFIAALGEGKASLPEECWTDSPRRLWPSFPAFWVQEEVAAAPHFSYTSPVCQEDLKKFISTKLLFTLS